MKPILHFLRKPKLGTTPQVEAHQNQANTKTASELAGRIDSDPARSMSISSFERQEYSKPRENLYQHQYIDKDPARKTLPSAFHTPYIERDPARDFGPAHRIRTKNTIPVTTVSQHKDDLKLPENIVSHSLIQAGIGVSNYSETFLQSPELLEAMKVRGFILDKNLDDQQVQQDLKFLVDDLNNKFVMKKPLIPSLDLRNKSHILAVSHKLAETLFKSGYGETAKEINRIIQQSLDSDSITVADTSRALSQCIGKTLQTGPVGNEPIMLHRALQSFKNHLDITLIEEAQTTIKQALVKQMAHLAKPGAQNNSALSFSVGIQFAGIGVVDLDFEIKTGYSTGNSLSIKSLNEKKMSALGGIAFPISSITLGISGLHEVSTVTKSVEQLVDDEAGKVLSHILKDPVQGVMDSGKMKEFKDLVNNYETARNNTDQLAKELRIIGVIDKDVDIKAPQEDTKKKLPKTRIIDEGSPIARLGAGVTRLIKGDGEIAFRQRTWQKDLNPERPFSAMMEFPEVLKHKLDNYKLADVDQLIQKADELIEKKDYQNSHQLREQVKKSIIDNLNTFYKYESSVRKRDSSLQEASGHVSKQLLKHLNKNNNENKHKIEDELGTKGRVQTFDKLIAKHAGLVQVYDKLMSDLSKPTPTNTEAVKHLDHLDLAISNKTTDHAASEKQFKQLLDNISHSFDHPSVSFSKKQLDKLRVITQVKNTEKSESFKIDVSSFSPGFSVEMTRSRRDHFDPLRIDGTFYNFKLQSSIDISAEKIDTLIDTIRHGMPGGDEEKNAVLAQLSQGLTDAVSAGYKQSAIIDCESFDGDRSYFRVLSEQKAEARFGFKLYNAGARLTASSAQRNNLYERVGTDSFFYLQSQYNTLYSAQKLAKGKTDADTTDGWTELAGKHAKDLATAIVKLNDESSGTNRHLNKLVNHIKKYNKENTEEALEKMHGAINNLKLSAFSLQSIDLNSDDIASSQEFKQAIEDLRQVFAIHGKEVIKVRKDERETVKLHRGIKGRIESIKRNLKPT